MRLDRSTHHGVLILERTGPDRLPEVIITAAATAVTALCREIWDQNDMPLPTVPAPNDLQRYDMSGTTVRLNCCNIGFVEGGIPGAETAGARTA